MQYHLCITLDRNEYDCIVFKDEFDNLIKPEELIYYYVEILTEFVEECTKKDLPKATEALEILAYRVTRGIPEIGLHGLITGVYDLLRAPESTQIVNVERGEDCLIYRLKKDDTTNITGKSLRELYYFACDGAQNLSFNRFGLRENPFMKILSGEADKHTFRDAINILSIPGALKAQEPKYKPEIIDLAKRLHNLKAPEGELLINYISNFPNSKTLNGKVRILLEMNPLAQAVNIQHVLKLNDAAQVRKLPSWKNRKTQDTK